MKHLRLCGQRSTQAGSFETGKWAWLGLLLVLRWPASARAQGLLENVNLVVNWRLETTCRYQEAVLPAGVREVKRYLQWGKRRYLLESVVASVQAVTKENYWLQERGTATLRLQKSHQELSAALPYQQGQLRQALFYHYPSPLVIDYLSPQRMDTVWVSLAQEFSPLAVLALRPDTARTGQTVYILNQLPKFRGDTLACYALTRSSTGDSCTVVLRERAAPASRQWRYNTQVTCVWEADRTRRKVTATRFFQGGEGSSHWVRTYTTAALTDFTELHYNQWPGGHAQQNTRFIYRRRFRQLNAKQSRDTYTLLRTALDQEHTAPPTCTIISTYQR